MLSSISIQGFKAITDKLELNNLAPINYLIGPNGSGKSSVLEGIRFYSFNGFEGRYSNTLQIPSLEFWAIISEEARKQLGKCKKNYCIEIESSNKKKSKNFIDEESKFKFKDKKFDFDSIQLHSEIYKSLFHQTADGISHSYFPFYQYTFLVTLNNLLDNNFKIFNPENKKILELEDLEIEALIKNKPGIASYEESFRKMHYEFYSVLGLCSIIDFKRYILGHLIYEYQDKQGDQKIDKTVNNIISNFSKNAEDFAIKNFDFQPEDLRNSSDGQKFIVNLIEYMFCLEYIVEKKGKLFVCMIEEPEKNLHPSYCKLLPKIFEHFKENKNLQFLISTHSPFIINSALELDRENFEKHISEGKKKEDFQPTHKVYHLDKVDGITKLVGEIPTTPSTPQKADFVSTYDSILGSIGVQPSDLLFANGVIWVEGPSDAIYIEKWLEMYALSIKKKVYKPGFDFQFQMYGGAVLKHYKIKKLDDNSEFITEIFKLNRNLYFVFDNDGKSFEESKNSKGFDLAKTKIIDQINSLKKEMKDKIGYWFEEDKKFFTIEKYADKPELYNASSFRKDFKLFRKSSKKDKFEVNQNSNRTKIDIAYFLVEHWSHKKLKITDFPKSLQSKIKSLYTTIQSWNEPK